MAMACPNCKHPILILDRLLRQYPCKRCGVLLKAPDRLHGFAAYILFLFALLGIPIFHSVAVQFRGYLPFWSVPTFYVALIGILTTFYIAKRFFYTPELATTIGGYCMQCGYDMTGNQSKRCPECGTKYVYGEACQKDGAADADCRM